MNDETMRAAIEAGHAAVAALWHESPRYQADVAMRAALAHATRAIEQATAERIARDLLAGLENLDRDDHWGTLVRPADVEELIRTACGATGATGTARQGVSAPRYGPSGTRATESTPETAQAISDPATHDGEETDRAES